MEMLDFKLNFFILNLFFKMYVGGSELLRVILESIVAEFFYFMDRLWLINQFFKIDLIRAPQFHHKWLLKSDKIAISDWLYIL